MAYTPDLDWVNDAPPGFTAERMNKIQLGVAAASADAAAALGAVGDAVSSAELEAVSRLSGQTSTARFTFDYVPAGATKEHFLTFVHGVLGVPYAITKALGSGASPEHVLKPMATYAQETGCNLLVNASGWRGDGQMMGLQIVDGQVVHGWDDHIGYDTKGRESLVVMRDGTFQIFDNTTTPAAVVNAGGWNSFTWGHAAFRDGVQTAFLEDPTYDVLSARQVIGDLMDGRILIATFPGVTGDSGATGADVLAALAGYEFNNLYLLDGGGSAQIHVDGYRMVKSSDSGGNRDVADVIGFQGACATRPIQLWRIVTDRQNGFSGGGIAVMEGIDSVSVRIQGVATSGATASSAYQVIASMPDYIPTPLYTAFFWGSTPSTGTQTRVTSTGAIDAIVPAAKDIINAFVTYPTTRDYTSA